MSNLEELQIGENKHGVGWKLYFFSLMIFLIVSCFFEESAGMKASVNSDSFIFVDMGKTNQLVIKN